MLDRIKAYLNDNIHNLETDGFLPGQDVTLAQAAALLVDFVRYEYAAVGKPFNEQATQAIIGIAKAEMPEEE